MTLPVPQRHACGCAVACVAYILDISYDTALKLFAKPKKAIDQGFLCGEIISALKKGGQTYSYEKVIPSNKHLLGEPLSIVFIARSKKYPIGHFLVKTKNQSWMNPWINFPYITPAEAGFEERLPGKAEWVVYSK